MPTYMSPTPGTSFGRRAGVAAIALAVAATLVAGLAGRTTAAAAAVVSLRVEAAGAPAPLFDGPVETEPHPVDGGDGSGPHPCSGPPGGAPGPTATGALDDAMRGAGIPWRGNWDPGFGDFFIDRIGPYASAAPDKYWSLSIDGELSAGGCLTTIEAGDRVLFFYGPLFGDPAAGQPGATAPGAGPGGDPTGDGQAGRGAGARPDARSRRSPRRLARRASRFLRRNEGFGREWADLALALRAKRRPIGDARRLAWRLLALRERRTRPGDVDSLALRAWALAATGHRSAAHRLALRVRAAQSADGGFPAVAGGASNTQSTGVALVGLRVAGLGPRPSTAPGGPTPLDYLASLARRNGSIAYSRGRSLTPVWVTAQALLGLTSKAKLLRLDTLPRRDDRTSNGP